MNASHNLRANHQAPGESSTEEKGNNVVAPVAGDSVERARLKLLGGGAASQLHSSQQNATSADARARQYQYLATRQSNLLKLVATFLDQPDLHTGLIALGELLHQQFKCERVVFGLARHGLIEVVSVSQQSSLDTQSSEVQLLRDAMQEACDQDEVIHFVTDMEIGQQNLTIVESHRAVLSGVRSAQICTVPLCFQGKILGAVLLESHRGDAWNRLTLEFHRQIAKTIASMVILRQAAELGPVENIKRAICARFGRWMTPSHMMLKFGALLTILLLVSAYFIPGTHRLSAGAELVSTERRLITAPLVSYLDAVHVAVGDSVNTGQPLLDLDVKDYLIEASQLESEISTAEGEYRSAMASYDRKAMAVAEAQLRKVRSELDLIQGQINRARILAPADGVVISGDLTQQLGAPVDRGEVLLEIAPAANYQIHLLVDETDVAYAKVGQTGALTLKSDPFKDIHFTVTAIHPIAVVGEGATRFRLDARPDSAVQGLRPGQTGIARVEVGEASTLWIWTHRFVEWARLQMWGWFG